MTGILNWYFPHCVSCTFFLMKADVQELSIWDYLQIIWLLEALGFRPGRFVCSISSSDTYRSLRKDGLVKNPHSLLWFPDGKQHHFHYTKEELPFQGLPQRHSFPLPKTYCCFSIRNGHFSHQKKSSPSFYI